MASGMWFILILVAIMAVGVYKIFELFVRQKERMAAIDKFSESPNTGMFKEKNKFPVFSYTALKGGCLLIGVGFGALVGFLIQLNLIGQKQADGYINAHVYNMINMGYIIPILIFGGAGLIAAFILERRFSQQDNK